MRLWPALAWLTLPWLGPDAAVWLGLALLRCAGKLVRAVKAITVHEPPNVLTVHLKRFEFGGFGSKVCVREGGVGGGAAGVKVRRVWVGKKHAGGEASPLHTLLDRLLFMAELAMYRRGRNFSAPGSSQIPPRTCCKPVAASASRGRLPKPEGV
eukprot:354040-Chlamydomonas_euryale.AAC.1